MEEISLKTWEDFENVVQDEYKWLAEKKKESNRYISDTLFRGHADSDWKLETTLERFFKRQELPSSAIKWSDYHRILSAINPFFSSFTENNFQVESFKDDNVSGFVPPCYNFMVYIRHHGFPSPLLDWTKSPYVAAFFAFENVPVEKNVAIYMYREYTANAKIHGEGAPRVTALGPYANTHKRHYLQQCQYTISVKEQSDRNHEYCSHELVSFSDSQDQQDFIRKYIIPGSERKKVLKKLDLMNINSFSLFGNEESMLNTLAYREIELKNN